MNIIEKENNEIPIITEEELIKKYENFPVSIDTENGKRIVGYLKNVKIEGHELKCKVIWNEVEEKYS
jgi:hypothetical protein